MAWPQREERNDNTLLKESLFGGLAGRRVRRCESSHADRNSMRNSGFGPLFLSVRQSSSTIATPHGSEPAQVRQFANIEVTNRYRAPHAVRLM